MQRRRWHHFSTGFLQKTRVLWESVFALHWRSCTTAERNNHSTNQFNGLVLKSVVQPVSSCQDSLHPQRDHRDHRSGIASRWQLASFVCIVDPRCVQVAGIWGTSGDLSLVSFYPYLGMLWEGTQSLDIRNKCTHFHTYFSYIISRFIHIHLLVYASWIDHHLHVQKCQIQKRVC
jgi:hypothetical protein